VELPVNIQNDPNVFKTKFSVDLDSVYKNEDGTFVYWLDRVEVEERNIWELVTSIEFIDGTQKNFQSNTFRIRTKPRLNTKKADTFIDIPAPSKLTIG
jgi:hypothetical protein